VLLWAWGFISPQQLQHMAELLQGDLTMASQDSAGFSWNLINILVSLGGRGTISGNMHRDLLRRLPPHKLPKVHSFEVPLRHKLLTGFCAMLPMILPHAMFSALYHQYKDKFIEYVLPSLELLAQFWDAVKGVCLCGSLFLMACQKYFV